jgi:CubicO group peptidase (beta-lactamase class C family)
MTEEPTSRLGRLQLVNPQRPGPGAPVWNHVGVAATDARPLPEAPRRLDVEIAGAGRWWSLEEWLAGTHGTSLVVVDRGVVVHEWYADGVSAGDLLLGASMSKSALAHLVGVAVGDGALRLDDPVPEHVPELTDSGYGRCTVRHLVTMTTGVDWVEDHRDPTSLASRLLACFSAGSGDSRELLRQVGPGAPPGTRWEYCTADSQVLDWVRERATGSTYAQALGELWRVLGCASDALVATDAADAADGPGGTGDGTGGVPLAGGGLAATARDWARLGMLQVDGTGDGSTRVLEPEWVDRSSAPPLPFLAPGRLPSSITTHAGFGYHWWPLDRAGRRVTADGSRGQFVYVDRDLQVVVVKTSRWPYDDWLADRQYRDLSYLGLPEVAVAAVATRAAAGS